MIHKTKVSVSFPGIKWVKEMQALCDAAPPYDPNAELVMFEGALAQAGVAFCREGSIKLSSISGQALDFESSDFEFVKYDKRRGLFILALYVGDGKESYDFDQLFPTLRKRPSKCDRAFLVVPVKNAKNVIAWALMPTDKDAHDDFAITASPEYLDRLVREARG